MSGRPFHVDLPGLLRVFGGHLYSSPGVFLRELVQNAVDAIVERRREDPRFVGRVRVTSDPARGIVEVADDGVGLDEARIELCLAKIGYSSKVSDDDLLGRFGIGLLAGFLVASEIAVDTRPAGGEPLVWRARPDGTYAIEPGTRPERGTTVRLAIAEQHRPYAEPGVLRELLERYVRWLPFDVEHEGVLVTRPAPWQSKRGVEAWLEDAGIAPLAVFPLASQVAEGALWIPDTRSAEGGKIDLLLRGMLLAAGARHVLPEWATFVSGIVEAPRLSPTASREAFVDDAHAAALAAELKRALLDGLARMATDEPERFERVLSAHYLALRGACVDAPELIDAIGDRMPFDTNVGRIDLRGILGIAPERIVRYVDTPQDFAHTAPLANAQGLALVNASYMHDVAFLRVWSERRGVTLVRLGERELDMLVQPAPELAPAFARVLAIAGEALAPFDIAPELGRFEPGAMPAFVLSDATQTERRAAAVVARSGSALARSLLANLEVAKRRSTRLVLNANNRLVQALPALADPERLRRLVRVLYVQSAMTLHRTLSIAETRAFSDDLLALVERDLHAVADELAN